MLPFKMLHESPEAVMKAATLYAADAKKQGYVPIQCRAQCVKGKLFFIMALRKLARKAPSVFSVSTNYEDYGIGAGHIASKGAFLDAKIIDGKEYFLGEKIED